MTLVLLIVALSGYLAVILETPIRINKTITALLTGGLSWLVIAAYNVGTEPDTHDVLMHSFAEIAGLLIFLLGAMTIVELVDLHKGFSVITHRIRTNSVHKLMWIVAFVTFFMSAMLDNLATTIIMVTLLRKLMPRSDVRLKLAGMVVIAANAGGAFSPIGDVTTTLLWIGGQVSAAGIATVLFVPSIFVMLVPLILITYRMNDFAVLRAQISMKAAEREEQMRGSKTLLIAGVIGLLAVPVIKSLTGLPPFLGVIISLGFVALTSTFFHKNKSQDEKSHYSVAHALTKVDISSILYFMGILLMVFALQHAGILAWFASFLQTHLPSQQLMVIAIGVLSALVDNGSLVAATQGMFPLAEYPMNDPLWEFIALCAGTGGSMLIIGSAAGIAIMEKEKITFGWYLRKITPYAIAGFIAGIIIFILQQYILLNFL
ncbi:MAG: sodium:proton antiporter NhaD [Weeksellaceae bacterium]|nr:sodium:proton antiporter NhaD [Weeksellaceae bacterium]